VGCTERAYYAVVLLLSYVNFPLEYSTCKTIQYYNIDSQPQSSVQSASSEIPVVVGPRTLIAYRFSTVCGDLIPRPVPLYTLQECHALRSIQRIGCEQTLHALPVVHPRSAAVVISRAPTVFTKGVAAHAPHSSPYQMQASETAPYLLLDPQLRHLRHRGEWQSICKTLRMILVHLIPSLTRWRRDHTHLKLHIRRIRACSATCKGNEV
jgi:hypothetical protein